MSRRPAENGWIRLARVSLLISLLSAAGLGAGACTKKSESTTGLEGSASEDTKILYYLSAEQLSADLGGREGADQKCKAARESMKLPCTRSSAAISVSAGDTLESLPARAGFSATGVILQASSRRPLAKDWGSFLKGPLERPIANGTATFWTGATREGGAAEENCKGFTSALNSDLGATGDAADDRLGSWKNQGTVTCDTPQFLPCVCW